MPQAMGSEAPADVSSTPRLAQGIVIRHCISFLFYIQNHDAVQRFSLHTH